MKTLKGPSLHLAQFSDENAPFNSLPAIAEWAAQTGFSALQIPAPIGVYSTCHRRGKPNLLRRSDRHVGGTGVGGQRIDQPYLRPADGGTPGLRCAV